MVHKWSVTYPDVNGEEQRDVEHYPPDGYDAEQDRRKPVL